MSRYLKYPSVLLLIFLICSNGSTFTLNQDAVQSDSTEVQTKKDSKNEATVANGVSVINIIVAEIDSTRIHAKDGRSFSITDSTRIINNHNRRVRVQTAELFFENGNLVSIMMK